MISKNKYKMDNNIRGIVIRYCRLYVRYAKSQNEMQKKIADIIDNNKSLIGLDLPIEIRDKLRTAIWNSTVNAKKYPYEVWFLPTISRNEFYKRKRNFILEVAREIGI